MKGVGEEKTKQNELKKKKKAKRSSHIATLALFWSASECEGVKYVLL